MLKIPSETLRKEISQIRRILRSIDNRVAQIPGEDLPSNDMDIEVFMVQLRGELALVAGRVASLYEVLE